MWLVLEACDSGMELWGGVMWAQAEACATEGQKLGGVIIFSYDATVRNDAETNDAYADVSCAPDAAGASFCAGRCAGRTAAQPQSAAAADCAAVL